MFPSDLQASIAAHLSAHAYFDGTPRIPVLPRCLPDFKSRVEEAASIGVTVLILPASGKFIRHEVPCPGLEALTLVRVVENSAINRSTGGTGQPAEDVAWAAAQILYQQIPKHVETKKDLTGGAFVFADWNNSEEQHSQTKDIYFVSEFTLRITGGDSAGPGGARLLRKPH
jgi:hypothetical protein